MLVATPVLSTHQLPAVLSGDDTTQASVLTAHSRGLLRRSRFAEAIWFVIVGSTNTLNAVLQDVPVVPLGILLAVIVVVKRRLRTNLGKG